MKKILFCLMALLCVMGVSAQARSITAEVPPKYQSAVNITIDEQSFNLMPQQVIVQEMDSSHVKICVLHNRGQVSTTIPIPYNYVLDVVKFAWDYAYKTKLISNEEYIQGLTVYTKQYRPQDSIRPCH
jgi:hypothetical protein